jgi:hypothetical protein
MAALPENISQSDFYTNPAQEVLQGAYQYVSLQDIVNNFILMYTGDDQIINRVKRDKIIFHAKRGLQELNYDVLREIKSIELELNPDILTLILPEDFVKHVRVSWVDNKGFFHPLIVDENSPIAKAYLQDNAYNYLFDDTGEVLEAAQNTYDPLLKPNKAFQYFSLKNDCCNYPYENNYNGRYGLETSEANINGRIYVNKQSGIMKFSSNVGSKIIVLEYISDGVESSDIGDVRIHKYAEEALYQYILWMLLHSKFGIQEYIIRRARKEFEVARRRAKMRLSTLSFDNIKQAIRGKDKTIK